MTPTQIIQFHDFRKCMIRISNISFTMELNETEWEKELRVAKTNRSDRLCNHFWNVRFVRQCSTDMTVQQIRAVAVVCGGGRLRNKRQNDGEPKLSVRTVQRQNRECITSTLQSRMSVASIRRERLHELTNWRALQWHCMKQRKVSIYSNNGYMAKKGASEIEGRWERYS